MAHNFGSTTHFQISAPDSNWSAFTAVEQTNVTANANYLLGQVESAFTTTTGWFGTDTSKFTGSNQQQIWFDQPFDSGAFNNGYGNPIHVDTQDDNASSTAGPEVAMVWMAEWSEVLMSLTGTWNSGDSSGEGLSHYSAYQIFSAGYNDYYPGGFFQDWLNGTGTAIVTNQNTASPNAARSDWVNKTYTGSTVSGVAVHGDGDPVSYGCAVGFIYYLTAQLGFSINSVISSYKGSLASCYHTLTGDSSDPFPIFTGLLASFYPAGTTASSPSPNPENPFPIAAVQFYDEKNTFGLGEATDIIHTQGGLVSSAFWVVIDGFSQHSFQSLGIQVGNFTGSFATLPGIKITPNPAGAQFENGVNSTTPQQIRIPFDITLLNAPGNSILKHFPGTGVSTPPYVLTVSLTSGGTTVTGSQASTEFELIAGADPYFTNIPPGQNNEPYLSQDLRVFNAAPAINNLPFPGAPAFATDSVNGAYTYIQTLLKYLNGNTAFTNPSGTDPFSLLPDQGGEGQTDSSVAPFSLNFANPLFPQLANNYNFAIARVRLRGSSGPSGAADNVRVFFRVFGTQSNDTDYQPSGTYASQADTAGHPGTPIPGAGNTTIPFFATGNPGAESDYQAGGPNIQTLTIPSGQDSLWWYFGCFLNFYDPAYQIGGQQIQALLAGTHHCIVAQIAFDEAPIPTGVSPLSWDQLAQRNLQFTVVDNPGPAATHRAPQTFDCRPSGAIGQPGGSGLPPDELMIDWGNVPKGSTASLYWPAVLASDVIALARTWGSTAPLSASDAHTLSIPINGGVSYVPIPSGTGQNFAGLFTLEMPLGIRTGQQFEVVVRRISTKRGRVAPAPPPPKLNTAPARRHEQDTKAPVGVVVNAVVEQTLTWRYVVGSFVVRIPVSTAAAMLVPEEITLSIMKWRLAQLSPGNRWAPVLERYIKYCSARLDGIGGNSSQVPPSLTWTPPLLGKGGKGGHGGEGHARELCGRVAEVRFDCHGGFEGFVLDDCCEQHEIESRERGVGELIMRACRDNLTTCVRLCPKTGRIEGLTIKV